MSEPLPASVLEAQVQALLQRVESSTAQRCASARAAASSQAREIVTSARAEALARVKQAVAQERARLEQGVRQAQAQADLGLRGQAQQRLRALLDQMWKALPGRLEARWRDPGERRTWTLAALEQAGALLPGRPWRIEHGAGWSAQQLAETEAAARSRGASAVEWAQDPAIGAGLKIRAAGVCLAATVEGLLAPRAEVESAFLAHYEPHEPGTPGSAPPTSAPAPGEAPASPPAAGQAP